MPASKNPFLLGRGKREREILKKLKTKNMFGLMFIDLITIIAFILFLAWFLLNDFSPPTEGLLLEKPLKLYRVV